MYRLTSAYGLKDGDETVFENVYRSIEIYTNIPYAITEEMGSEEKKVFLLESRKFSGKGYKSIEFFRRAVDGLIARSDVLLVQNTFDEWGILNPFTGEEIEPTIHNQKPRLTYDLNIFILSETCTGLYFKNVRTNKRYPENFMTIEPLMKTLYRVSFGDTASGIYDLEKARYAVDPVYLYGRENVRIHPNEDLAIVLKKYDAKYELIRAYTQEVILQADSLDFDYTERQAGVIADGERISIK